VPPSAAYTLISVGVISFNFDFGSNSELELDRYTRLLIG
jgi:hypothetical protein